MDTRRHRGVWWLPEAPTNRVTGILAFDGRSWTLETIGRLEPPVSDLLLTGPTGEPDSNLDAHDGLSLTPLSTIHGECSGVPVTVLGAFLTATRFPNRFHNVRISDEQHSESWTGPIVATGLHFAENDRFVMAELKLAGLSDWWPTTAGRGRLRPNDLFDDDRDGPKLDVALTDGWTLELGTAVSSTRGSWKISLSIDTSIRTTRSGGFTYEELWAAIIRPLRMLIGAAHGSPSRLTALSCWKHHEGDRDESTGADVAPPSLNVKRPTAEFDVTGEPSIEPLDAHRMFFTSYDLRSQSNPTDTTQLKAFIRRWLELSGTYPLPTAMLDPVERTSSLNLKVLQTLAAAEGLHRAFAGAALDPPSTSHLKIIRKIEDMNSAQLSSADRRLNSNELRRVRKSLQPPETNFAQRLQSLALALDEDFAEWFFDGQVVEWSSVAADIRNMIAHGYGLLRTHHLAEDPATLVALLETTRVVVELRMLVEAGLPMSSGVRGLIERSSPTVLPTPGERAPAVFANRAYLAVRNQRLVNWRALAVQVSENRAQQ